MAELSYQEGLKKFLKNDLGITPGHLQVYEQAFTHRSLVHELNLQPHDAN